jgi:nucleoside-diphosphate-sugar epimerase
MNPLAADLDHVLAHTTGLWEELRGRRIFITGGTGFFGCWLLESFAWANDRLSLGAEALVLTRNPKSFAARMPQLAGHKAIQFHGGDFQSFTFPPGEFFYVIHAAAEASSASAPLDPVALFDANVQGTRRVLEFARGCGAQKLLFTSSGAVYGRQPSDLTHVPEDYRGGPEQTDPRWAYGEGKRAAEMLCALYAKQYGLEPKIARCFAFVGPYLPLDGHFAVGNFIRDSLKGGPIRINGDGTPFRSYLYAADLAIWLWTILVRGQSCRAYNVGSDADLTIAQLARRVAEVVNPQTEVVIAQPADSSKPPERYVPAIERVKAELGLRPWVDLEESIKRMAEWNRQIKQ